MFDTILFYKFVLRCYIRGVFACFAVCVAPGRIGLLSAKTTQEELPLRMRRRRKGFADSLFVARTQQDMAQLG